MPIPFRCSKCGADYNAPDQLAGKKVKCKGCGSIEQVPDGGAQAPASQGGKSPQTAATTRRQPSSKPSPSRSANKPPQSSASAVRHGTPPAAGLGSDLGQGAAQPPLDPFAPSDSLVAADPFAASSYGAAAPNPFGSPLGTPQHGMPPGPLPGAPFAPGLGYSPPRSRGMSPAMVVVLIVGGLLGLGVLGIAGVVFFAITGSRVEQPVADLPNESFDAGPMPSQPVADSGIPSSPNAATNPRSGVNERPIPVADRSQPLGGNGGSPTTGNAAGAGRTPSAGLGDYGGSGPRNLGTASGSASTGLASGTPRPPDGSDKPLELPPLSAAVPADPLDESLSFEFSTSKLVSIPIEKWSTVTAPYVASPYVAIIAHGNKAGQVWDLRTQQPTSNFNPQAGRTASRETLSPDGRYYASLNFNKLTLVKTDAKEDDEPRTIEIGPPLHFIAMTNDRLFTIEQVRDPETRVSAPKVRVHELSSGELATEFGFDADWIAQEHNVALSAGGRHLAVFVQKDRAKVLEIIDTSSGKIAAECRLPNAAGNMHPGGVAFSADGSELAALLNQHGMNLSRLVTWTLADGKAASQVPLAHSDYEWLRMHGKYRSPPLQSIAGGDGGWFVCGRGVVDRQGKVIRELPEGNSANSGLPRRAFSSDGFLLAGGGSDSQVLTNQPGAAEEKSVSQPARQAMASSANADLGKAKKIELPSGTVKWEVTPDPAPAAKEGLGDNPTELKHLDREAISYHFSSPTTGIAAIYCMKEKTHEDIVAENNARMAQAQRAAQRMSSGIAGAVENFNKGDDAVIPTPPCWIDRYDLASNEYLGRLNLTRGSIMHDLSPNGERALVQYGNALQVWSLADGKQISQWDVPGLNAQNKNYNDCCRFSDNDHVMARVDKSRVARWRLPDAQADYVIDKLETAYGRAVERISPGGKYWMTLLQRQNGAAMIAMIETATGQLRGVAAATTLGGTDAVSCYEARFRPDGEQAGFSLSAGSAYLRTILDVKTGRIFCEPGSYEKFFWAGDRHWYNNRSLYDIAYRRHVWNYSTGGVSATAVGEGDDGQLWFDAYVPGSNATHWLALAKTPDANTLQQIDGLFAGKAPLVDRGSQVSLDVACENAGLNQKVTAALTSKLKAHGIEVASGAPIRVSATANVTDTKTKQYEAIGGRGGSITVNVTTVTCSIKFLDNGKSIWETTTKVSSDPGLIISGDVAKQEQSHWPKAERWLLAAPLPNRIYPPPTPGSSTLAFPGVSNKAAPAGLANNASAASQADMANPASAAARAAEARARLGRNPFNPSTPAEPEPVTLSETEVRQQVADAYLKILEKQSWDDLRGNSALSRPLVKIRWALGTEVSPQSAKRDVDNFSNYAGRRILDGLKKAEPSAATPPEPVVLGMGTRGKLLKEARAYWADLLLLADVETKLIGLTKRTNTTITVRVIDVESGNQVWTSEPLTQLNPIIGRQFAEYVLKEVGKTFALRPLAPPTAANVARRTEELGKKKFLHPLTALTEVAYYRHRDLLTEEAAGRLYGEILGPAEGVQYTSADAAKRGELIDKWLPGWINEE